MFRISTNLVQHHGLRTACILQCGSSEGAGQPLIYVLYTPGSCFGSEISAFVVTQSLSVSLTIVWCFVCSLVWASVKSFLGCHFILVFTHLLCAYNSWQRSNLWKLSFLPAGRSMVCFICNMYFLQDCCVRLGMTRLTPKNSLLSSLSSVLFLEIVYETVENYSHSLCCRRTRLKRTTQLIKSNCPKFHSAVE